MPSKTLSYSLCKQKGIGLEVYGRIPPKTSRQRDFFGRDKLALQVWSSSVPCWTSVDLQSGNAWRTGFVPAAVKAVQEAVRNTYRPT